MTFSTYYFLDPQNGKKKKPRSSEDKIVELVGTQKRGFRRKLDRMRAKQVATTLKAKKIKDTEGEPNSVQQL